MLKYQSPYIQQLVGKNKTAGLHNLSKNQGLLRRYLLHLPSVLCWIRNLTQLLGSHLAMVPNCRFMLDLSAILKAPLCISSYDHNFRTKQQYMCCHKYKDFLISKNIFNIRISLNSQKRKDLCTKLNVNPRVQSG